MFRLHQAWDQKVRFCLDWSSGLQKTQICSDWPIRPQKQSISLWLPWNGAQITKWNYVVTNVVTQCPYHQHYPPCVTGHSLSTQFWSRGLLSLSQLFKNFTSWFSVGHTPSLLPNMSNTISLNMYQVCFWFSWSDKTIHNRLQKPINDFDPSFSNNVT